MDATVPIGIQPGTKLLQIVPPHGDGMWVLWLYHDRLMKSGTYLKLYPDGKMERVTLSLDGTEEVVRVR